MMQTVLGPKYSCLFRMFSTLVLLVAFVRPGFAQLSPPKDASYGGSSPYSKEVVSGIAWYGLLKDGLKEALRTGKPILLVSAAPQCNGVPGMW